MRKIRLKVENLAVESFGTEGSPGKKAGTVRGYDVTDFEGCVVSEASNCASCLDGCPHESLTCMASCLMTDGNRVCKEPYC
jgi:hypothetical protein